MIAIIFEVTPNEGMADDYLKIAGEMRGFVEQIDGFISVERFQSLTNPDKLLSVSFFESEAAVEEWRRLAAHRSAQKAGRETLFRDYRLRVLQVLRDYGKDERGQAPSVLREEFVDLSSQFKFLACPNLGYPRSPNCGIQFQ